MSDAKAVLNGGSGGSESLHTTEGDIECSCQPLILTIAPDGSISRVAGGLLESPIDTGPSVEGQEVMGRNADYRAGYRAGRCLAATAGRKL